MKRWPEICLMRSWFQKFKKEGKTIIETKQTPPAPTPRSASPRPCSPSARPGTRLSHWACWSQFPGWDCWKSKDAMKHTIWCISEICIFINMFRLSIKKLNSHDCQTLLITHPGLQHVVLVAQGSWGPTSLELLARAVKGWALQTKDRNPGPCVPGLLTRHQLASWRGDLIKRSFREKLLSEREQKTRLWCKSLGIKAQNGLGTIMWSSEKPQLETEELGD